MMTGQSQGRDAIFDSFSENAQLVIEKLRENGPPRDPTAIFDLTEFWNKLEALLKAVSFEATKLALCFSSSPAPGPDECQSLLSSVEMKTLALVSLYYGLPKEYGVILRKNIRNLVINVVEGMKELTKRIKSAGYKSSEDQLQSTGTVWAACDKVQSTARNNKDAALKELKVATGLVKDAIEELDEAKSTDGSSGGTFGGLEFLISGGQLEDLGGQENAVWSEQDRAVIHPCLGLANACKACLKKVTEAIKKNVSHEEMAHIAQLDHIAELSDEVSPNLDELVSCLYAPMNYTVVRANASLMAEVLHKMIAFVQESQMVTPADSQWIQFLSNAIDHNVDKVKTVTMEEGPR